MAEIETRVAMFMSRFGKASGQGHSVTTPGSSGDTTRQLKFSYGESDELMHELILEATLERGVPVIKATFKNPES